MIIKIPSKDIYNLSNPIIRDNIINGVNIEQKVVFPSNDYETSIYNDKLNIDQIPTIQSSSTKGAGDYFAEETLNHAAFSKLATKIFDRYVTIDEIIIPKHQGNNFITKLYNENRASSGYSYTQIQKYSEEKIFYYQDNSSFTFNNNTDEPDSDNYIGTFDFDKIREISKENRTLHSQKTIGDLVNGDGKYVHVKFSASNSNKNNTFANNWIYSINEGTYSHDIYSSLSYTTAYGTTLPSIASYNNFAATGESDLGKLTVESDEDNYYIKNIKVLVGRTIYVCATALNIPIPTSDHKNKTYPCKIVEIDRNVQSAEITFYGNTIGIDINQGSISYGDGKKPHLLTSNELLQDSATVENTPLTKHLANNILTQYKNGKETAVLRCSVGEYYSHSSLIYRYLQTSNYWADNDEVGYDDTLNALYYVPRGVKKVKSIKSISAIYFEFSVPVTTEILDDNKIIITPTDDTIADNIDSIHIDMDVEFEDNYNLAISTKDSTLPMVFDIGDEVVPMVCDASGVDQPMSLKQDGSAKSFNVVGTKIYYDGAVWQELTLQEKTV